jgi:predicted PurR-regulated permease PerM
MILTITVVILSDSDLNQEYLFCSINFKFNPVAKTMKLAILLILILFLVAYSICYFNIGKVCYNNITTLEQILLELNSLETGIQFQMPYRYLENNILNDDIQNSTHEYYPKFQVIKTMLILKFLSIIIAPFIEILTISIFIILNIFLESHSNKLMENICYWIAEFSPLTDSLMILFLHRETREEFYNLITRK